MSHYNEQVTEGFAVLGSIAPQASNGTLNIPSSNGVAVSPYQRLLAEVHLGALGVGSVVTAKFQAATTTNGTYSDVTGAAITTINSGSENIARVELRAESIESLLGTGYQYVKFVLANNGTNTNLCAAQLKGFVPRYEPGNANNVAAVTQTVVV